MPDSHKLSYSATHNTWVIIEETSYGLSLTPTPTARYAPQNIETHGPTSYPHVRTNILEA
jgi:hypothetical protein